jgi:hypothetical protein
VRLHNHGLNPTTDEELAMAITARSRTALVVCLLLVGGAAFGATGMWIWTVVHGENGEGTGTNLMGAPVETFTITGALSTPIIPGGSQPLDLTIANPNELPLIVLDLMVAVKSVDAPRATTSLPCSIDDFIVGQAPRNQNIVVPGHSDVSLSGLGAASTTWPNVGFLETDENQDGCKGATLTLAYTGTGKLDR